MYFTKLPGTIFFNCDGAGEVTQAVFGRPAPASRGLLNSLSVGSGSGGGVGGGSRRGGGTVAAAQHLASVVKALDGDVRAAAVLGEHGESFRYSTGFLYTSNSIETSDVHKFDHPLPGAAWFSSAPYSSNTDSVAPFTPS